MSNEDWSDIASPAASSTEDWSDVASPVGAEQKKQNKGLAGDLGTDLKRSFQSVPGAITGLLDIPVAAITGKPMVSKGWDLVGERTGFQPSKWNEEAKAEYSPARVEANRQTDEAWKDGTAMDIAGSYLKNPGHKILGPIVESVAPMVAGGIAGRALTTAAKVAPMIAGGIGEGGMMAGSQMQDLIGEGVDARKAAGYSALTGIAGAGLGMAGGKVANSKIGQRLGLSDIDTAMAGGVRSQAIDATGMAAAKEYGKRIIGGGVVEGLIEEAPQSIMEKGLSNLAQDKPVTEGMARAGVEGALAGFGMGAAFNAIPGSKYIESKRAPAEDQPISGLLPAPTMTGTPSEQMLQSEVDRQNSVDAAQKNADQLYAERAAYQEELAKLYPSGLPTITRETRTLQQFIDETIVSLGNSDLKGLRKVQRQKQFEAALKEVVGITHDENGREIPLTMGALLDSQAMAEDAAKRRVASENAGIRAQQLADEEMQQPDVAAPSIPVVGPLSAAANVAVQSGASQAAVMQQAAAASVSNQDKPDTQGGISSAAQTSPLAQAPAQANDAQVGAQPAAAQKAQGVALQTQAQPGTTSPIQQSPTPLSIPPEIVSRVAKRTDKELAFMGKVNRDPVVREAVAQEMALRAADTRQVATDAGAQSQGIVARMNLDVTDSTDEKLSYLAKFGMNGWREAAIAEIERRAAKATPATILPSDNQVEVLEYDGIVPGFPDNIYRTSAGLFWKTADNKLAPISAHPDGKRLSDFMQRYPQEWVSNGIVNVDNGEIKGGTGRIIEGQATRETEQQAAAGLPDATAGESRPAPAAPERRGIKTIDKWTAEELQARLDRADVSPLTPESEQRIRAELAKKQPAKKVAESGLRVGKTPNASEPVTVRNGVVFIGDYPAMDYDTEADITVPEGATNQQIADAINKGGAIGSRKIFGLKADDNQDPIKNEAPAVATATAEPATTEQGEIKKEGQPSRTRMTPLNDQRITKYAGDLRAMSADAGWAEEGGRLLIDADGKKTRTVWIPRAQWFMAGMINSPKEVLAAVNKAANNWPMSAKEKRTVSAMMDFLDSQNEGIEQDVSDSDVLAEVGYDEQTAQYQEIVDLLGDFDIDAPGALQDEAAAMSALGFTETQINEITQGKPGNPQGSAGKVDATADEGSKERVSGRNEAGQGQQQEGQGFDLAAQTNDQAAEQFAQQQAGESDAPTKEQADRERDAVPFSMQMQSQPKPQGVQTGLFTADGRVSAEARPARGEIGASLTKEERATVLKSLIDVYRQKKAPREMKGVDGNGNERYGYVHSPELFEKSDITGAMVRYYVTLPDGRIAHPTELFADYTQADIDAAMQKEIDADRERERNDKSERERLLGLTAPTINEANRKFNHAQRFAQDRDSIVPALLTNGELYLRSRSENADKAASLLGDGWRVEVIQRTSDDFGHPEQFKSGELARKRGDARALPIDLSIAKGASREMQDAWFAGFDNAASPKEPPAELSKPADDGDQLDAAKIRAGYTHRSLGGLGDKVKMEQGWFDNAAREFAEKVGKDAESDEQKALADKLLADFKDEYKVRRYRVMEVGAGVVSSAVAGRNNFNSAQAGRRGSALDRAEQEFAEWQKGAIESGVRAIRAARSPEQIAAEQQAKADKAAKKKAELHALLGKLMDFKKGDDVRFGNYPVAKVSLDKSGYPSSVTVEATDLTDNKFDIARMLFDGDKDKLRAAVDEIRASRPAADPAAPKRDLNKVKPPKIETAKEMAKSLKSAGYPNIVELAPRPGRHELRVQVNHDSPFAQYRFMVDLEKRGAEAWEIPGYSVPDFTTEAEAEAMAKFRKDLAAMNAGKWPESEAAPAGNEGAGNIATPSNLSPADKAIYGMAAEGKSAAEILKFIDSASRSPFNRQVAKLLLKTGINPTITVGDGKGWKFNAGDGNKYAAGYDPKKNMIALFKPGAAERNMVHELIHAATIKALGKKGLASAQMKALYNHVKKTGKLKGMYGMSDVDEFIAEAFSNPKFQERLKQVSAPATGGKVSSAWNWFVRIVRGILGIPQGQDNALSAALEIGVEVMLENMKASETDGAIRYAKSTTFHDARSFVRSVLSNNGAFRFFDFASVSEEEAAKLKAKTGLDVSGFKHAIDDLSIKHVMRKHGNMSAEIARGQIGINEDDLAMIPDIVANYDSVERGENQRDGTPSILYKKTYGNGETYYVEEVRKGRMKLVSKSMWKVGPAVPRTTSANEGVVNTSETSGGQPDLTIADQNEDGNGIRYNVAEDGWSVSEPSKMDDLIYSLQDKQIDLKRVMQSILKTGKQVRDEANAYLQEELFHGRAAKGVKDFLDLELRPLLKEMQAANVDMGDFEEYLWNRHAEERNNQIAKINPDMPDGGSGIETAEARAYLAGLTAEQKRVFESLAAKVEAMNRNSQAVLVQSGLEKQETIDAWNGAYQHYVPLQREDVDSGHMGTGNGFSVRGSSTKRAMGSGKKVVDIIANLTMQRERNIVRAEKNRVSNALMGLAVQNPNPDFWTVDKAPKERVVENKAIYTVLDADGNTIEEFTRVADAEKLANKTPGSTIDQRWGDRVTERVTPGFQNRDNVLLTRINGEDHYVIFNERDERAMRMATAMKNLDVDNLGRVLSVVGKATRYLASINTQHNPVFGVINLIRDAQGALLNLSSTPLAGEQKRVLGYTKDALVGIYKDIRAHRAGKVPSSNWAALFEEFQKEGGQTGYRDQYANAEARAEAIKSELAQFTEGKAKQLTRGLFGWLSDYNETMENAVRLAAYKAAKEKGMSKQQAASLAKNITVNFNRKGQMATQVGALYAFFNASVQGTARIAQTLFDMKDGDIRTARLSKVGKRIVQGGIMLGSMQALLLAAAGFDDDEPPEFVRERNLILPIGDGKYLTLAMPLGFHIIPGIGRMATEFVLSGGKDPAKRVVSMLGMFAEAFNPMGSSGLSIQTLTPSVVDPFAALAENRDFTGREIYRENFNANDPSPGNARAKDVATVWSRFAAEVINRVSGGTEFKPGAFSPSPDAIDYLIAQAGGGVAREVSKVFQTGGAAYTGDDLPFHKIPLVGRFIGDTEGQSGQSQAFYSAVREINLHEREIKGLREAGRLDEAREYMAENPVYRMAMMANSTERQVRKLRDVRRKASEDGDSEKVRAINEQITGLMSKFNERAAPLLE